MFNIGLQSDIRGKQFFYHLPEWEPQLSGHAVLGGGRRPRVELEHPLEVLGLLGGEAHSHLPRSVVL